MIPSSPRSWSTYGSAFEGSLTEFNVSDRLMSHSNVMPSRPARTLGLITAFSESGKLAANG
jgi:hypothetical protein